MYGKRTVGFFLSPHTPYGRLRLARFARVRLSRHALPISLLILRKKPTFLQSNAPRDRPNSYVCVTVERSEMSKFTEGSWQGSFTVNNERAGLASKQSRTS